MMSRKYLKWEFSEFSHPFHFLQGSLNLCHKFQVSQRSAVTEWRDTWCSNHPTLLTGATVTINCILIGLLSSPCLKLI